MINKRKLFENLSRLHPTKILVEESFPSLRAKAGQGASNQRRVSKGQSISGIKYEGIGQGADGQAITKWTVPSQSNPSNRYEQLVEIAVPVAGGLFGLAKQKWDLKRYSDAMKSSDVKVHCSCPDFHWSGMAYNLGPNGKYKGSNAMPSNSLPAPDVRDPERQNVLCKHLIAVFGVFPANASSIFSQARKYDANIETDPELTNQIDKGEKPLAKDVKMVEVPTAQSDVITDAISKSVDELAKNQNPNIADDIINDQNQANMNVETTVPEETETGSQDIIATDSQIPPEEQNAQNAKAERGQSIIDEKNQATTQSQPEIEEPPVAEIVEPNQPELEKDKPQNQTIATQNPAQILGR